MKRIHTSVLRVLRRHSPTVLDHLGASLQSNARAGPCIAWIPGCRSPAELEMTCSTSELVLRGFHCPFVGDIVSAMSPVASKPRPRFAEGLRYSPFPAILPRLCRQRLRAGSVVPLPAIPRRLAAVYRSIIGDVASVREQRRDLDRTLQRARASWLDLAHKFTRGGPCSRSGR